MYVSQAIAFDRHPVIVLLGSFFVYFSLLLVNSDAEQDRDTKLSTRTKPSMMNTVLFKESHTVRVRLASLDTHGCPWSEAL